MVESFKDAINVTTTIARLVASDFMSINMLATSQAMATLFKKAFGAELNNHLVLSNIEIAAETAKKEIIKKI